TGHRTLIIVPTTPDFSIASFVYPSVVFGGDSASLTYRVRNVGQVAATGPWTDAFYLSTDTVLNIAQNTGPAMLGPNARRLHSRVVAQTLLPNGQYQTTVKVPIPHTFYGERYYFYACADDQNQVFEVASTNNLNPTPDTTTVILRPPPDLVILPFSAPSSVTAGTHLTVSWTGFNDGASEPFYPVETFFGDQVWLCPDPSFNPSTAIPLGTVYQYGAHQLLADETYAATGSFRVPNGISGQYYVYVMADAGNHVFEYIFENNNVRRSTNFVNVNLVYADLHPTALTAPATVPAHTSFTVSWTVQNTGSAIAAATGSWDDVLYANGQYLATVRHTGPLAAGASYTASATVTLPITIPPGTVTLKVVTDRADEVYEFNLETNNERLTTFQHLYSDDLLVQSLAAPGPAFSGQPLTVSWQVRNDGAYRTLASAWSDELYLSANPALDASDLRVALLSNGGHQLAVGGQYNHATTFTVPHGLNGTYYLIARTAVNPNGTLSDADPANNQQVVSRPVVLTTPCDLQVVGTPVFDNDVIAGQQITVQFTVKNTGPGATLETSWNDGIYVNTSPTMAGAVRIGNAAHAGRVSANAQYTVTTTLTVPGYLSGNYYLFIVADNSLPTSYSPTLTHWGGAVQYGNVYEH
ncbi:MAG TPA: CARDB domain-containing protein, partial [bacterium]|nr:CARDB domain-containing protein [bacterium]